MKHETHLRRRLRTLRTLHDAVSAMRSLAAHHFRLVRQTLPAAREYRAEIEGIIAEIGIRQPLRPGVAGGLLVVASDLGLCGDYNSRLAQAAIREREQRQLGAVYSIGRRIRPALSRAGVAAERSYDAPSSLEGLSRLLLKLAQDVLEDFTSGRIGSLYLVAARFGGVGHFEPVCTRLLPIEPVRPAAPFRRSPYVTADHLAAVAVRELLYISLHEVLLDALASEHGMRLTAAEAALEWLDRTAAQTARHLSASRSEAATQELLDIIAGGPRRVIY